MRARKSARICSILAASLCPTRSSPSPRAAEKIAVVSALEFGRARKDSGSTVVLPLEPWLKKAARAFPRAKPPGRRGHPPARQHPPARGFSVPDRLSRRPARPAARPGPESSSPMGPLFPDGMSRRRAEAAAIREGNRCSALGFAAAERVLRASKIRGGWLFYRGAPLTASGSSPPSTSPAWRPAPCLPAPSLPAATRPAIPHHRGSGPLRANELIIVDIFPRVGATGYYGDMTRTFLRGRRERRTAPAGCRGPGGPAGGDRRRCARA